MLMHAFAFEQILCFGDFVFLALQKCYVLCRISSVSLFMNFVFLSLQMAVYLF